MQGFGVGGMKGTGVRYVYGVNSMKGRLGGEGER